MPLADLALYQNYAARRRWPGRRLELLLAQVSMVLARVNGNDASLQDFLFDPVDPAATQERRDRDMTEFFND